MKNIYTGNKYHNKITIRKLRHEPIAHIKTVSLQVMESGHPILQFMSLHIACETEITFEHSAH